MVGEYVSNDVTQDLNIAIATSTSVLRLTNNTNTTTA
jgi:hypothetical protein